jgi:hypothetical protein
MGGRACETGSCSDVEKMFGRLRDHHTGKRLFAPGSGVRADAEAEAPIELGITPDGTRMGVRSSTTGEWIPTN